MNNICASTNAGKNNIEQTTAFIVLEEGETEKFFQTKLNSAIVINTHFNDMEYQKHEKS